MLNESGTIFLDQRLQFNFSVERLLTSNHFHLKTVNMKSLAANGLSGKHSVIVTSGAVLRSEFNMWFKFVEKIKNSNYQIIYLVDPDDIELISRVNHNDNYLYGKTPVEEQEFKFMLQTALYRLSPDQNNNKRHSHLGPLIGEADKMQNLYRMIRKAASGDFHVLIVGETGTGKDLTAQAIHQLSERKKHPFVPVNLASLPAELVSSELFGHEKGAYTSAVTASEGKFELAQNGSIFLDEISAIDAKIQVTLLRLIEQKNFYRLGAKSPTTANARIIAASNENLSELVEQGKFRQDLFYRLDVFRIVVPPLRERKDDIPILVDHFIRQFNRENDKHITGVSFDVLNILEEYDWPGNIRELKNVIQRGVLMCNERRIRLAHLPARFSDVTDDPPVLQFEMGTTLEEIERESVIWALKLSGNNRSGAARLLGISRRALYNKIERHGIL